MSRATALTGRAVSALDAGVQRLHLLTCLFADICENFYTGIGKPRGSRERAKDTLLETRTILTPSSLQLILCKSDSHFRYLYDDSEWKRMSIRGVTAHQGPREDLMFWILLKDLLSTSQPVSSELHTYVLCHRAALLCPEHGPSKSA